MSLSVVGIGTGVHPILTKDPLAQILVEILRCVCVCNEEKGEMDF